MSLSVESPVTLGIAGLGRAGLYHAERLGLREDFCVVAGYDVDPQARRRGEGLCGTVLETWEALLAEPRLDAVLIATPPATHGELARAALAAGKHVIVETPICLTASEARELVEAANRAGRVLAVATTRRGDDDFCTALAAIDEGLLGEVRAARFINRHFNPFRGSERQGWRRERGLGGGVLWEFGVTVFDQLLRFTSARPISVWGRLVPARAKSDDALLAAVEFENGLTAQIEVDRAAHAPLQTGWMLTGDHGSYANFTHYSATEEGEIVDVPLTSAANDPDRVYGEFVRRMRAGEIERGANDVWTPIAIVEGVIESDRRGEIVRLEE